MTTIDVSPIWNEDCELLSASAAELGRNAGKITWDNAMDLAERIPLIADDNRDDVRDHFADYGAWEREEIDAWSDQALSAMVWQEAAADMRHFREHCGGSLLRYEADCEDGNVSGRLEIGDRTATIYLGP